MSQENLQPLPQDIQALLAQAGTPRMPPGFSEAVGQSVKAALASSAAATAVAVSTAKWMALVATTAVLGTTAGYQWGKANAELPSPKTSESTSMPNSAPASTSTPEPPAETTQPEELPPPAPAPRLKQAMTAQTLPSDGSELLQQARVALLKREGGSALTALQLHRKTHPKSALSEERDALEIQALLQVERREEARSQFKTFTARYPDSILRSGLEQALK